MRTTNKNQNSDINLVGHHTLATQRFSHENVTKRRAEATRLVEADQAPSFRPCLLSRTDALFRALFVLYCL